MLGYGGKTVLPVANRWRFQDQILRQLGKIAETVWETLQAQHSKNEGAQSTTTSTAASQTLSDVKLAVLEQFQTLVPNEERRVHGEIHALYTEVAHHEKLQASMTQRIQMLTCENEELERRVQGLEERLLDSEFEVRQSALVTPLQQEETTDLRYKHKLDGLQQQLDERESQIKQLLKVVEMQAVVISAEPVASPHEDDEESSDVQELRCTSELVSESRFYDEYDELEVPIDDFLSQKPNSFNEVHQTFSGYESQPSITGRKGKSNLRDARDGELSEAVDILQAQLEMYIRCFQRRNKSKR